VVDERLMQLLEAVDPKLGVRRPVGRVERTPCRSDSHLGVADRRVGSVPEHDTCRGIDRRKRPFGLEQLSVDQQAPIDPRSRPGCTGLVTRDGGRFLHHPPQHASLCDGNFILIFGESYIREGELKQMHGTPPACN